MEEDLDFMFTTQDEPADTPPPFLLPHTINWPGGGSNTTTTSSASTSSINDVIPSSGNTYTSYGGDTTTADLSFAEGSGFNPTFPFDFDASMYNSYAFPGSPSFGHSSPSGNGSGYSTSPPSSMHTDVFSLQSDDLLALMSSATSNTAHVPIRDTFENTLLFRPPSTTKTKEDESSLGGMNLGSIFGMSLDGLEEGGMIDMNVGLAASAPAGRSVKVEAPVGMNPNLSRLSPGLPMATHLTQPHPSKSQPPAQQTLPQAGMNTSRKRPTASASSQQRKIPVVVSSALAQPSWVKAEDVQSSKDLARSVLQARENWADSNSMAASVLMSASSSASGTSPSHTTSSNAAGGNSRSKKRKATPDSSAIPPPDSSESDVLPPGTKKPTDHNAIERKYRDNINDGFSRLRDSVPVLRALFNTSTPLTQVQDTPHPVTGLIDGLKPCTKQGKSTILNAARNYIVALQRERARLGREVVGLEEILRGSDEGEAVLGVWRAVFEESEKLRLAAGGGDENDFPWGSSEEDGEPDEPIKKKSRSSGGGQGSKVLLAVFLSFSLFSQSSTSPALSTASSTVYPDGYRGTVLNTVRELPRRAAQKSTQTIHSHTGYTPDPEGLMEIGWKIILGLVVLVLLLPTLERMWNGLMNAWKKVSGVPEEMQVDLASAMADKQTSAERLRGLVGAPRKIGLLGVSRGIVSEFMVVCGLRKKKIEDGLKVAAWLRIADAEIGSPISGLTSYLYKVYLFVHLFNFSDSSPRLQATMSLLHVSLADGMPSAYSNKLWNYAQRSAKAISAEVMKKDIELRVVADALQLSLSDVISTCPQLFNNPTFEPPLVQISSALALDDLHSVWSTIFNYLLPTSSSIGITRRSFNLEKHDHQKSQVSIEISNIVSTTFPGTEAHTLSLATMAAWCSMLDQDDGFKWATSRLVGEMMMSGSKFPETPFAIVKEVLALVGASQLTVRIIQQQPHNTTSSTTMTSSVDTIASFLLQYHNLISTPKQPSQQILKQTLHLRAMLASPVFQPPRGQRTGIEEEDLEMMVDYLVGLGKKAAGWKDENNDDGEENDSGFESGTDGDSIQA